jgi:hypothetical protein
MNNKPPYLTSDYYQQVLDEIAFLWQLDNPEWVKQREKDWQFLVKECGYKGLPKYEHQLYEGYFKYGKLESYDPHAPTNTYIPHITMLIFTPYRSAEDLKFFLASNLFTPGTRKDALSSYIFKFAKSDKKNVLGISHTLSYLFIIFWVIATNP